MVSATAPRKSAAGIPETQEQAAAKEAAADGKSHRIQVAMPKGSPFEAELLVGKNAAGWWVSGDLKSPMPGKSKKFPAGKPLETEAAAIAAGFTEVGSWLETHKLLSTKVAAQVRPILVAVDAHQQRILGSSAPAAAPPATSSVPLAERVNTAPLEQIELAKISPSPSNNRKDFDKEALQELADSLASHGMLQPISVYRVAGEGLELIFGERRYRAAKLAKLKVVPCRVIDCTTVEADELRLIENLKRKDLSAIEEAQGYQDLIAKHGYTQQKLAEQLGIHQSTIANRIRFLRLPAAWQQLVIAREISESHARGLVDYAEMPASVVDQITKAMKDNFGGDGLPPVSEWAGWLYYQAKEVLRSVEPGSHFYYHAEGKGGGYRSGTILFTEKHLAQWGADLELVTLKSPHGTKETTRYAANVAKWEELHGGLAQAKAERAAKKAGAAPTQAKEGDTRSPTELARRTEQLAEQYEKRIRIYWQKWVQRTAAARCEAMSDDKTIRLLIAFAAMNDRGSRKEELFDLISVHGGKRVESKFHGRGWTLPLLSLMTVEGKKLLDLARKAIAGWLQHDVEGYETALDRDELPALVELFGIDLAKEWRVDEEFLQLHTKAQLAAFWTDWKIKADMPEKRGDVVAAIMAADGEKRLPAPKVLLKGGK